MTTYYVDWEKADDSGNGLTLATAKKTLNGAEDIPVAAGDHVWVRPGVYRETLTVDVSGSSGNPITYQGDVAGQIWHPGGVVRITGSDNDQTVVRELGIDATSKSYRVFSGFHFDAINSRAINVIGNGNTGWIIEDISITNTNSGILFSNELSNTIIRRAIILRLSGVGINFFTLSAPIETTGVVVENCIISSHIWEPAIEMDKISGILVKNCFLFGCDIGLLIGNNLGEGQSNFIYNCVIAKTGAGLYAQVLGEIVEDYNVLYNNDNDRINVSTGTNSISHQLLTEPQILYPGHHIGYSTELLSRNSSVARRTDNGDAPTDDFYGMTRPVTNGKRSWGPIQFTGAVRDTTITDGSGASLKLPDAGEQFFMRVPTAGTQMTISLKVYREVDYAGTLPQLIVRQPGQADETDTDTGNAEEFNTLSVTISPATLPPWIDVFIRSNNTASSGNFSTYWDTLTVS